MTVEAVENRRRELASAVKRLRVAATSDPQRSEELADALVDLGAEHLLAWDFAEAATVAPEAALLAARILASRGPSGPYASLPDAVRYLSASVQLAAVQAGLGQPEGAGRTLDGLDAWREQLGRLPLLASVPDTVALWFLIARARATLDTEVATANAFADAAEVRLHDTRPPAYLFVAVHLLVADARWAAGRPESSLAHHRLALDAHRAAAADPAASRRPAVARTAAAPVPAVYEAYAQRLAATGDPAGAISLRRAEVALLQSLPQESVPPGALLLARNGLATALARAGREDEAAQLAPPDGRTEGQPFTQPGERIDWEPASPSLALAPQDPGRAADALARWRQAEQAAMFAGVAARADAERTEALLRTQSLDEARRRAEERAVAERAAEARAAAAAAEQESARTREAELAAVRAEREAEAARAAAEERRLALAREHARSVDPDEARAAAAELELARRAVGEAVGDAALAAAQDRLATVLRPLAAVQPEYRDELAATLESLVGLLWRLGDPEGSRAAAREAKALAV